MAALDEFRQSLERAGISDEKPLRAVLMTVYETAVQAREVVGTGARGLSPAGEKELIARVAECSAEAAQHEVERLARRIGWKNAGLMALSGLALLGAGYAWGASGSPTGFFGRVAAENDVSTIERFCRAHTMRRDERTACDLGTVWLSSNPVR